MHFFVHKSVMIYTPVDPLPTITISQVYTCVYLVYYYTNHNIITAMSCDNLAYNITYMSNNNISIIIKITTKKLKKSCIIRSKYIIL